MNIVMNAFVVRFVDGSINEEATAEKFRVAVEEFKARQETDQVEIARHVHDLFDENKGVGMNQDAIRTLVFQRMGGNASNHGVITERVAEYLEQNTQGKTDKETKEVERPNSAFVAQRGRNGGTYRRCDMVPRAEKK